MANATFDIFRQLPNGDPIWVEVVSTLEGAQERLAELAISNPGSYAIYDASQAVFITRFS